MNGLHDDDVLDVVSTRAAWPLVDRLLVTLGVAWVILVPAILWPIVRSL